MDFIVSGLPYILAFMIVALALIFLWAALRVYDGEGSLRVYFTAGAAVLLVIVIAFLTVHFRNKSVNEIYRGFSHFVEERFGGTVPNEHYEITFNRDRRIRGDVKTILSNEFIIELIFWLEDNDYNTRFFSEFLDKLERGDIGERYFRFAR